VRKKNLVFIVCIILLASCGMIEKFKTRSSDSPVSSANGKEADELQNLAFSEVIPEIKSEKAAEVVAESTPDKIADVTSDSSTQENNNELASLMNDKPAPIVENTPKNDSPVEKIKIVVAKPAKTEKAEEVSIAASPVDTGVIKIYKVKKGETLMQIAFKIYGDISKWKDLKKLNQEKVSRNTLLPEHLSLKYSVPETEFNWNPEGAPYLIKGGDTLGIISNSVYQTPKKWKDIWENNKPLIKNPNVIYSGFTLYYKNDSLANNMKTDPNVTTPKREVSSEKK
jgi:nucleoid-associated protein YgaU